jgi:hypothetical protein
MILQQSEIMKTDIRFLPVIKGEIKEGVGDFYNVPNLPYIPSFIRRGLQLSILFQTRHNGQRFTMFLLIMSSC